MFATASDVFSFGRLMYRVLADKMPFDGLKLDEVAKKIEEGSFSLEWPPDTAPSTECRHTCDWCQEPEPTSRPSMSAVHGEVLAWPQGSMSLDDVKIEVESIWRHLL